MGQLLDLSQRHKLICLNFFKFGVYGIRIRPYRVSFRIVTVKKIIVVINSILLSLDCEYQDNIPSQK